MRGWKTALRYSANKTRLIPWLAVGGICLAPFADSAPGLSAEYGSAKSVLPGCRSALERLNTADDLQKGICIGRIESLTDVAQATQAVCLPRGLTRAQSLEVVLRYAETHPDRMAEPFTLLALAAIKAAWPCRV